MPDEQGYLAVRVFERGGPGRQPDGEPRHMKVHPSRLCLGRSSSSPSLSFAFPHLSSARRLEYRPLKGGGAWAPSVVSSASSRLASSTTRSLSSHGSRGHA